MKDHIFYEEFTEICADWYDWIEIWLRKGETKATILEAFAEMVEEVEEVLKKEYENERNRIRHNE